jgi:hypothetical protein
VNARRIFVLGIVTALILGYVGPVRGYLAQRAELRDERAKLTTLERNRDEYRAQLAAIDTDSVLEVRARALGLVKPGERAFVVAGSLDPRKPKPHDDGAGGPFGWLTGLF